MCPTMCSPLKSQLPVSDSTKKRDRLQQRGEKKRDSLQQVRAKFGTEEGGTEGGRKGAEEEREVGDGEGGEGSTTLGNWPPRPLDSS